MGIIKETDNITLDISWKGWKRPIQRNEYLLKTRSIVEKIAFDAKICSKKDGWTSINLELPNNSGTRNFIIIKKIDETNNKYPRQYNQIIKNPL